MDLEKAPRSEPLCVQGCEIWNGNCPIESAIALVHQIIRAEVAPRFIYGGKAQANLFAFKFLFGFEYTF
jgi:hypothetical protein